MGQDLDNVVQLTRHPRFDLLGFWPLPVRVLLQFFGLAT
jgi:hypothetical protein